INSLVRDVLGLAESEIRMSETRVRLYLAADLPAVRADPIQIEQVLLNLVRNGIEAMADVPVEQRELAIRTRGGKNGEVEVVVSDRGHGLPVDAADRVFESFFSTKA